MEAHLIQWFHDAHQAGWTSLKEIRDASIRVLGEVGGLWRCDCCHSPVLDVLVADSAGAHGEAVQLSGDVTLCEECYESAQAARKKIVVVEDDDGMYEDVSALSDDEIRFAGFLDRAESARNWQDRELIREYPREQRSQIHRYQDSIENDRRRSGKS